MKPEPAGGFGTGVQAEGTFRHSRPDSLVGVVIGTR